MQAAVEIVTIAAPTLNCTVDAARLIDAEHSISPSMMRIERQQVTMARDVIPHPHVSVHSAVNTGD